MALVARRKYWGPFCVVPRVGPYVHEVYPTACGIIQEDGGEREMTAEELDKLTEDQTAELEGSFRMMSEIERAIREQPPRSRMS